MLTKTTQETRCSSSMEAAASKEFSYDQSVEKFWTLDQVFQYCRFIENFLDFRVAGRQAISRVFCGNVNFLNTLDALFYCEARDLYDIGLIAQRGVGENE